MRYLLIAILLLLTLSGGLVHAQDDAVDTDSEPVVGESADVIEAYVPPGVSRVGVSDRILWARDYRQVFGPVNVLDAPGGNLLYTRGGEYYVSVSRIEGDWAEINPGEWVPVSALGASVRSRLNGILFADGIDPLDYPIGFTDNRVAFWTTEPGIEVPITNANALAPYTLVHIFAEIEIDDTVWVQVGVDQWLTRDFVRVVQPIAQPRAVNSEIWMAVDLAEKVVMAYEGDTLVFATLAATGQPWSATEPGIWRIYANFYARYLTGGALTDTWYYYLEDVPHLLFFNREAEQGFHGVYWHDTFGQQASHGCVNLSLNDAYWLFTWADAFMDREDIAAEDYPQVYVYDTTLPDLGLGD